MYKRQSPNVRKKRTYDDLDYDMLEKTLDISAVSFHKMIQAAKKLNAIEMCIRDRGRSRHRIRTRNPYHKPAAFSDYLLGGSGQLPFGRHYPPHSVL